VVSEQRVRDVDNAHTPIISHNPDRVVDVDQRESALPLRIRDQVQVIAGDAAVGLDDIDDAIEGLNAARDEAKAVIARRTCSAATALIISAASRPAQWMLMSIAGIKSR
jgi:hypothetical protein